MDIDNIATSGVEHDQLYDLLRKAVGKLVDIDPSSHCQRPKKGLEKL